MICACFTRSEIGCERLETDDLRQLNFGCFFGDLVNVLADWWMRSQFDKAPEIAGSMLRTAFHESGQFMYNGEYGNGDDGTIWYEANPATTRPRTFFANPSLWDTLLSLRKVYRKVNTCGEEGRAAGVCVGGVYDAVVYSRAIIDLLGAWISCSWVFAHAYVASCFRMLHPVIGRGALSPHTTRWTKIAVHACFSFSSRSVPMRSGAEPEHACRYPCETICDHEDPYIFHGFKKDGMDVGGGPFYLCRHSPPRLNLDESSFYSISFYILL